MQMFRSLFFSSSPLLSPFSSPSSLISFSFRPTAYNRVKRHGVYKSFSCRAPFSVEGGLLPPSFSSSKTSDLHFFLPRNRKSPEGGGGRENEGGRKIDEARANVTRSSRFLRGSLACHKRGKDIHFNKQINEIGDTAVRGNSFETREHARVPLVFCFLPSRV